MQAALERGYNGGDALVTGWHRMGYVVGCGVPYHRFVQQAKAGWRSGMDGGSYRSMHAIVCINIFACIPVPSGLA